MYVLLIEDNPIDARAVRRSIATWSRPVELIHETSADDALARLTDADETHPGLILLDLNLPGRNGHEVLETIKSDPDLRRLPVIVLTTSSSHIDVAGSYDRGANAFVTKPSDLAGWKDALERIERFWVELATLPEPRSGTGTTSTAPPT